MIDTDYEFKSRELDRAKQSHSALVGRQSSLLLTSYSDYENMGSNLKPNRIQEKWLNSQWLSNYNCCFSFRVVTIQYMRFESDTSTEMCSEHFWSGRSRCDQIVYFLSPYEWFVHNVPKAIWGSKEKPFQRGITNCWWPYCGPGSNLLQVCFVSQMISDHFSVHSSGWSGHLESCSPFRPNH